MKEYEDHTMLITEKAFGELNDNTKFLQTLITVVPQAQIEEAQLKFLETFSYNYPLWKLPNV